MFAIWEKEKSFVSLLNSKTELRGPADIILPKNNIRDKSKITTFVNKKKVFEDKVPSVTKTFKLESDFETSIFRYGFVKILVNQ